MPDLRDYHALLQRGREEGWAFLCVLDDAKRCLIQVGYEGGHEVIIEVLDEELTGDERQEVRRIFTRWTGAAPTASPHISDGTRVWQTHCAPHPEVIEQLVGEVLMTAYDRSRGSRWHHLQTG